VEREKKKFSSGTNIPFVRPATIFQQDNASTHTAKKVQAWMNKNKVRVLPWSRHSPDLNPIDNLWANVKERVDERHLTITNKKVFWEPPKDHCQTLVESMPHGQ